jgi:outer membrane protein assembly factor BamB
MKQRARSEGGAIGCLLLIIGCAALAFVWPWLPQSKPGLPAQHRYLPLQDGQAGLYLIEDDNGRLLGWRSVNVTFLSNQRAFVEMPPALQDTLTDHYPQTSLAQLLDHRTTQLYLIDDRRLDAATNQITAVTAWGLRSNEGDLLLGISEQQSGQLFTYTPPAYTSVAAQLTEKGEWISEGTFGSLLYSLSYRFDGVDEAVPDLPADCLQAASTSRLWLPDNSYDFLTAGRIFYCADQGVVMEEVYAAAADPTIPDELVERHRLISATDMPLMVTAPLPPPPPTASDPLPLTVQPDWELTRFSRTWITGTNHLNSIPATWLPGEPPLLLAAAYQGELRAFDPDNGRLQWQFRAAGTFYGPPVYDGENGRIYLGASDKQLYALDRRGLFLWAFTTKDNVASRPLIVGDRLVFGSEDGRIYCLDKNNGTLLGKLASKGAVVSSPAAAAGLAVIGSDDGAVYAVDPATCDQRWRFVSEGAVEAPLLAANETVYVASRDGYLYALDAASGDQQWRSRIGRVLRTAPALAADRLYLADGHGYLHGIDRENGRILWSSPHPLYLGTPLAVSNGLLVLAETGSVEWLDDKGSRQQEWPITAALATTDNPDAFFIIGPTAGGGVVWLVDSGAVIHRLGPPWKG